MVDPFAEVVSLLQPSLPLSKIASGSGAWRVEPGWPLFCVILEGVSRIHMEDRQAIDLQQGDFVLIPSGAGFAMSSVEIGNAAGIDLAAVTKRGDETRHGDPDGPPDVRMLVGRLEFGAPDAPLLLALLPRLIHVRGEENLPTLVQMIRNEARSEKPAREMVLSRLLEILLIEALRSSDNNNGSPGLVRGLADGRLAVAIRRIHEAPHSNWTIKQLANEAALSRSVFFDRFRKAVGLSPMEYLLSWRMALAKSLLRKKEAGVKEIAERVGYGSASAFTVAFTRFVGTPPVQYGRDSSR